jgi:hypothetical protein
MALYDRPLARPRPGYGPDFGPPPEPRDAWEGPVYGPARYGLGPYHQRLRRRRRPDQELKQEVEEALFLDTWVDAEAIEVEVEDGVVTLRGTLPDHQEVRFAHDDAWDVDGVTGVRCDLRVDATRRPPPDGVER